MCANRDSSKRFRTYPFLDGGGWVDGCVCALYFIIIEITSHYLYTLITSKQTNKKIVKYNSRKENELKMVINFVLRLPKTGYGLNRLKSLLLVLLFSYSVELIGLSSWELVWFN